MAALRSHPEALDVLTPDELSKLVASLLGEVVELKRTVVELREEIARLKGVKGRPDIKPSGMDNATEPTSSIKPGQRRGRDKVRPRVVVEDKIIKTSAPAGSRSKATRPIWRRSLCRRCMRFVTAASGGRHPTVTQSSRCCLRQPRDTSAPTCAVSC